MSDDLKPGEDLRQAMQRKASFRATLRAVAWSFFGVRKGSDYDKDVSQLNPLHVIAAGVIVAAVFVVGLILLVRGVVSSGAAMY